MKTTLMTCLATLLLADWAKDVVLADEPSKPLSVLLIGNSQCPTIISNQLLEKLAASDKGGRPVRVGGCIKGGASLRSHWEAGTGEGTARAMIASGSWDYVVLQDIYNVEEPAFRPYARQFHALIKESGSGTVLFGTASILSDYPKGFERQHVLHFAMGRELGVPIVDASYAFVRYFGDNPSTERLESLFAKDRAHPGLWGSYLYSCMIYSALTERSPIGLAAPAAIPADVVKTLQETAWAQHQETVAGLSAFAASTALAGEPLALNSDNPHYFQFRGEPAILITSAEHYGAVLNAEFDYVKYLDELASCGLNHTRLFSGVYVEPQGAFNIARNTLAPNSGRFLAPWARSDQPGYANGGNKFDLSKWDEAYFARLRDFLTQAGRRGIVVEVNLFCPMYEDGQWKLSPLNAANNINGIGTCDKHAVFTLDSEPDLLAVQERLVRKFVTELQEFDNLFYEICNEPYFGGVTLDWQHHMVDVIVAAEKDMSRPHLLAMNIANGSRKIEHPHPAVSVFNFHYSYPPTAVSENFGLNKVIGENESGFKGTADAYYRHEAWEFLLAGGGLFNNLDYSFTVGHEDGTFAYPASQPGGGNRGFRSQLRVLKDFLHSFDFPRLKPDHSLLKSELPEGTRMQMLTDGDRQVAIYLQGGQPVDLALSLRAADYRVEWIDVLTGNVVRDEQRTHSGGTAVFTSPSFTDDIALRIIAGDARQK